MIVLGESEATQRCRESETEYGGVYVGVELSWFWGERGDFRVTCNPTVALTLGSEGYKGVTFNSTVVLTLGSEGVLGCDIELNGDVDFAGDFY